MAGSLVRVDVKDHVATVIVDRPPLNVYTIALLEELAVRLMAIQGDPAVRVVVLQGAGKCFSAGVDVGEHAETTIRRMLASFRNAVLALADLECVTVAKVHAHCLGGGFELAAACDLVYATSSTKFGVPEISLGVFPPAAVAAFPAIAGSARAADLILTGRTVTAEEAERMGFVSRVFSDTSFEQEAGQAVRTIAALSGQALRVAKRALRASANPFAEDRLLQIERLYLAESVPSEDAKEGLRAFVEKRPPVWKDR